MIDVENLFNQTQHDAVEYGGDMWRIYQKQHTHERVAMDRTFDNHEFHRTCNEMKAKAGYSVARRYANWG